MRYQIVKNIEFKLSKIKTSEFKFNLINLIFITKLLFITFIIFPIDKLFSKIKLKFYKRKIQLNNRCYYWETRKEFYEINDKFRNWLKENKIKFHQTQFDIRKRRFKFYFKTDDDLIAFKLKWL